MKKLNDCIVENCIPTPSSCVEWNGGDIESLGICNGMSLNTVIVEIVNKLEDLAGEDISKFDIDSLLDICKIKAPLDINLISILTVIKDNQICLKDYIDTLSEAIAEISKEQHINVQLKCLADFDNLGNQLAMTRESLDQLVVNEICDAKERLDTIEAKIQEIAAEVANIDPHATVDELSIATCVDAAKKPTSQQVVKVAKTLCDLQDATGNPAAIAQALAKTPSDWNTDFGLITGWDLTPDTLADSYGNLLLAFTNLLARVKYMEENCCAMDCDDVKVGFSAVFFEDMTSVIITFSPGAGTKIPNGFTDKGSTGTITDKNGNVVSFNLAISNNHEEEIYITGLDLSDKLDIHIDARIGNDSITCDKCLDRSVTSSGCAYCEITATGDDASSAVIFYETSVNTTPLPGTTTTSSTTTTTTVSV